MKYSFLQDSQIYFILTILRTNIFFTALFGLWTSSSDHNLIFESLYSSQNLSAPQMLSALYGLLGGLHLHSGQTSIGEIHHFQHLSDTLVKQYGLNVKELKTDEREVPVMKCQKSVWHLKLFWYTKKDSTLWPESFITDLCTTSSAVDYAPNKCLPLSYQTPLNPLKNRWESYSGARLPKPYLPTS